MPAISPSAASASLSTTSSSSHSSSSNALHPPASSTSAKGLRRAASFTKLTSWPSSNSKNNNPPTTATSDKTPTADNHDSYPTSSSSVSTTSTKKTATIPPDNNNNNNNTNNESDDGHLPPSRPSVLRRLSPALAARLKFLEGGNNKPASTAPRSHNAVGRIPEDHIKELDSLHQDLSIKVQKRGGAWSGGSSSVAASVNSLEQCASPPSQDQNQNQTEARRFLSPSPTPSSRRPVSEPEVEAGPSEIVSPVTDNAAKDHDQEQDQDQDQRPEEVKERPVEEIMPSADTAQPVVEPHSSPSSRQGNPPPEQTDLEKYLKASTQTNDDGDVPPPPPPKDSPRAPSISSTTDSYFNPRGLQRTESIFSFSRESFSNQLSQLTSISLPQPSTLEASIANISTAPAAVRALTGAADQVGKWINKASEVLGGLEAEDDVEWAAAAGREGLEDVDKAVTKFESLVNVYVKAIEEVQLRKDIASVGAEDLNNIVVQMESTLKNWAGVRKQLKEVKAQVELAMEWEELWSVVLGDVGQEMDNLSRLIFEMEEKRHMTIPEEAEAEAEPTTGLDINELETIVEETPANGRTASSARFSMTPTFPASSPLEVPPVQNSQDESNLLALFARMQPLRASLDFLPMRLSMFQGRADSTFPSACEELDDRRKRLEKGYKKLEVDAEALRRELSEDRWVLVFRNAGRQAQKMCESVEKSVIKLQEGLEAGQHINSPAALTKRIENFEAKKLHYGPAIERVVGIIQKGVNDRLTVNGEILRLLSDVKAMSDELKEKMNGMEITLEELSKSQHLRDSVSSIVTTMDSPIAGSTAETPGSSPASSVVMPGSNGTKNGANQPANSRRGSSTSRTPASSKNTKRYSGLPRASSSLNNHPRNPSVSRASPSPNRVNPPSPRVSNTPTPSFRCQPPPESNNPADKRPRWNGSANTSDLIVGHHFRPLSATSPSPHRKPAPTGSRTPRSSSSSIPLPSPLSREASSSPAPGGNPNRNSSYLRPASRLTARSLASPTPSRPASTTPVSRSLFTDPPPYSKLRKPTTGGGNGPPSTSSNLSSTARSRQSYQPPRGTTPNPTDAKKTTRPGTSLGHGHSSRRTSLLPQPKPSGRESSMGGRSTGDTRPPWR
ncbi:hypothetical protein FQN54_007778 [Arachnomyces sp. PD_36]|nr:hypothetical protein FQN54_007778 [Arachnomyces sp. PD_36]